MQPTAFNRATLAMAIAVGLTMLGACDRANNTQTAGQKLDEVVAKSERKSEEIKGDAREAGKEVRDAASNVADSAAGKARDMAITTQVNAQLARDASLSALSINVDTSAGQVVLRGTAPDAASRDRAATMAKGIEGVVQVDNQLTLKAAP